MESAIVNNAKVIIVPKPIHQLGHTYGKGVKTMTHQGDLSMTPNEVAQRDITTYENVLNKEDAINKKGKKLTDKDKKKLKSANDDCKKKIKTGLDKMKEEDYDKFLKDQIKNNKDC